MAACCDFEILGTPAEHGEAFQMRRRSVSAATEAHQMVDVGEARARDAKNAAPSPPRTVDKLSQSEHATAIGLEFSPPWQRTDFTKPLCLGPFHRRLHCWERVLPDGGRPAIVQSASSGDAIQSDRRAAT